MVIVEGIIPVLITPFTEDQKLNEAALRKQIRRFLDAGAHGLFALGTNGEFVTLTREEKIRVVEITLEEAKGKVPVYAGTGGTSTAEVVELSETMEKLGVDVLTVITPSFYPCKQHELIAHYKSVAASTSLPIVMYNIPARTGNSLEPKTVAELAKVPNIVGVKDSSGNFQTILGYIAETGPDFAVLAGTDALLLYTLIAGGKGGVSGSANVVPELMLSIYNLWKQGDIEQAVKVQRDLRPLSAVYQKATLPSVFKEAMNMMGLEAGPSRPPVGPVPAEIREELYEVLLKYKELGYIKGEIQK